MCQRQLRYPQLPFCFVQSLVASLYTGRNTRFPGMNKIFQIHLKAVGDAVDVIEIADYLGGIMNGPVGETVLAQGDNVIVVDLGWGAGEFFGVGTEGQVGRCEGSQPPVRSNQMYQLVGRGRVCQAKIVGDLSPEVVSVSAGSVKAMVEGGDNGG